MATPTDPTKSGHTPSVPPGGAGQPPPTNNVDPTGAWSKFLSSGGSGQVATPKEVEMFMQGMLKMFNVIIQQQNEAYKRANEKLKRAAQGDE